MYWNLVSSKIWGKQWGGYANSCTSICIFLVQPEELWLRGGLLLVPSGFLPFVIINCGVFFSHSCSSKSLTSSLSSLTCVCNSFIWSTASARIAALSICQILVFQILDWIKKDKHYKYASKLCSLSTLVILGTRDRSVKSPFFILFLLFLSVTRFLAW